MNNSIIEKSTFMQKYFVMLPGFATLTQSSKTYDEYCHDLSDSINRGLLIVFEPEIGNRVYFFPSKSQHMHMVVMTEKQYDKWRREQMFAQGQGIRQ